MADQWIFSEKDRSRANKKLPNPLEGPDGVSITSPEQWPAQREYLKAMLEHYLYGHTPRMPGNIRGELIETKPYLGGTARRERVRIFCGPVEQISFDVHIIRPNRQGRFPVVVGNHRLANALAAMSSSPEDAEALRHNLASDNFCPIIEELINRGYAVAWFYRDELCPDNGDYHLSPLSQAYPGWDWRVIAMWSWGHSRIADYLETISWADTDRLITTGLSRGGKAALHSAVFDERFAVCASSCSGCGGSGSFRYLGSRLGQGLGYVESIAEITGKKSFWYWFSDNLAQYAKRENQGEVGDEAYLPFDTHFLRALIAPRAMISTDGLDDVWCGPFGTQLSWHASQPVFNFLDAAGKNALFFREGGHYYNDRDWREALAFCDKVLYGIDTPHTYTDKGYHNTHRIYYTDFFDYE
jgi:hypothetical protein